MKFCEGRRKVKVARDRSCSDANMARNSLLFDVAFLSISNETADLLQFRSTKYFPLFAVLGHLHENLSCGRFDYDGEATSHTS